MRNTASTAARSGIYTPVRPAKLDRMIRPFLAAAAIATTACPLFAAQPITGRWLTADGGAVVAIGDCGGSVCGRVARVIKGPPAGKPWVDSLNPDPKLKTRPLV